MPMPRGPFRPASQYPADPYAQHSAAPSPATSERSNRTRRAPWALELDALESLQDPQRSAVLILGDPSPLALEPLLAIKSLATSLLIVATARQTLDVPQNESTPEIRLLRIEPESTQEGAARLADIMKWAEKMARQWRREIADAEQPVSPSTRPSTRSRLAVMHPNNSQLLTPPTTPRMRPLSRLPKARDRQSYINAQRALDMVINFLPNANAKGIIKEAILITTIVKPSLFPLSPQKPGAFSSGFTEPSMSRVPSTADLRLGSRWSRMFSGSRTSLVISNSNPRSNSPSSLVPPIPQSPARIIHILPFTYSPQSHGPFAHAHLIRKLEAFLLDFSYSPTAMKLNSNPNMPSSSERLRPFLLGRTGLTETMRIRRQEYTLGDLVLGGLLDNRREVDSRPATGDGASEHSDIEWSTGRAWLGGVADIVLQTPGGSGIGPSSASASAPVSSPSTPKTLAVPPPRPARNDARDARRTISLGNPETRQNLSIPVPSINVTQGRREKRGSLPTPPDSSESDSPANYAQYWNRHGGDPSGTTVSLNDWEGSPGWSNQSATTTAVAQPNEEAPARRRSALISAAKSSSPTAEPKRRWWTWGRGRKISSPM
ncbi:hypothetical protein CTheo_1873 [Ceratobasidium theobromae]|uniref:Uncharacterized protein n=1 Tax=Ceratobasidium theobromae TaxID=1582974 RepID=A0A5N5QU82_9AGAM|nr:hypothetical protein CTheo_1873 [Ceratobasidium theobromae]